MRRKMRLIWILLGLLALVLSACRGRSTWDGIIKIAIVAPYSGPATADGLSMLAGARLAANEVNDAGGVGGRRIVLIAPDERTSSTSRDVMSDPDVVAVVGHVLPDGERAEALYREAGLIWLATEPLAAAQDVYPMVAAPATVYQALDRLLRFDGEISTSRVAGIVDACRRAAEAGGGVVDSSDMRLICGGKPDTAEEVLTDASAKERILCVAEWCDGPELVEWAGSKRFDYLRPVASSGDTRAWAHFVERLGPSARVPTWAALGYDGVRLVVEAARRAARRGVPTRDAVAQEMHETNFPGVLGAYGPHGPSVPVVVARGSTGVYPATTIFRLEGAP
jgi:hypothetical protein